MPEKHVKKVKGAPPSKWAGANDSPSRDRYWQSHRLRDRKVARLVKYCKLSYAAALALWTSTRKRMRK